MKFRNFISSINYFRLRQAYIIAFMVAVFTRVLMPINYNEPQIVNTLVFSLVALFGLFVAFIGFLNNRELFWCKQKFLLGLFLVVCLISSLMNIKYGLIGNIRNLGWLFISFFVLYCVDYKRSRKDILNEIKLVGNVLSIVWFLAVIVSFIMFLMQVSITVEFSDDVISRQGFVDSRLFGIFEDPNIAAMTSIYVIGFSAFNYKFTENAILKVFYIVNIVFQFFYVVLSGSRTAEVAIIITAFIILYCIFKEQFNKANLNVVIKHFSAILLSIVCCIAIFFSINITRKGLSYLPSFFDFSTGSTTASFSQKHNKKPVVMEREDTTESSDISNCRFRIWKSAIELFKTKPIFGTSPRNMRIYAKTEFPSNYIGKRGYAVHNAYIDVLTSTGVAGALCIALFFAKYLIDVTRYLFGKRKINYNMVLFCLFFLISAAVAAMFLSDIFFVSTISVLVFWLFLGYAQYFIYLDDESSLIEEKGQEKVGA